MIHKFVRIKNCTPNHGKRLYAHLIDYINELFILLNLYLYICVAPFPLLYFVIKIILQHSDMDFVINGRLFPRSLIFSTQLNHELPNCPQYFANHVL